MFAVKQELQNSSKKCRPKYFLGIKKSCRVRSKLNSKLQKNKIKDERRIMISLRDLKFYNFLYNESHDKYKYSQENS